MPHTIDDEDEVCIRVILVMHEIDISEYLSYHTTKTADTQ